MAKVKILIQVLKMEIQGSAFYLQQLTKGKFSNLNYLGRKISIQPAKNESVFPFMLFTAYRKIMMIRVLKILQYEK